MNKTIFLIESNNPCITLRFIQKGEKYCIQKNFPTPSGIEQWYELVPMSQAQSNYWKIVDFSGSINLPVIMKERDSLLWKNVENSTFLIEDCTNKMRYKAEFCDYHGHFKIRDLHSDSVLVEGNSSMHQRMDSFEHRAFMTVLQNAEAYITHLDRYGIILKTSRDTDSSQWSWEGLDYTLMNDHPGLGDGVAQLTLKHGHQEICIIPIQPFVNKKKGAATSEYNLFCQDTCAQIPRTIVKQIKERENPGITIDAPQCWQYTGTERYIVYKMHNGQPTPTTAANALYLCYLYLGLNQPEKAWAVLEDCDKRLGGLAGTYEELRYLHWSIKALPYELDEDATEAIISNPPHVACKLKALSLLTQFSSLDKKIAFPKIRPDAQTDNEIYEKDSVTQTQSFYENLNNHIYTLYTTLQAMRRELPVQYTLSDPDTPDSSITQAKSLLDYYHTHAPKRNNIPIAVGALGYEWVCLNLSILRKEHSRIAAKLDNALTPYEQRRKTEIERFIKEHEGVAKVMSKLTYSSLDLMIPKELSINARQLSLESKRKCLEEISTSIDYEKLNNAITFLKMTVSDDNFILHFDAYLLIAKDARHRHHKRLMDFCKATLIAYRHVPLDKQATNLPLLCNVLYRLSGIKNLPHNLTIDGLIIYSRRHPAQEIQIPQLQDDVSEKMVTAPDLWKTLPFQEKPIPIQAELPSALLGRFDDWFNPKLKKRSEQWRLHEMSFDTGQATLGNAPSQTSLNRSGLPEVEYQAGCVKYHALKSLQQLAINALSGTDFKPACELKLKETQNLRLTLIDQLLPLAQKGPNDPLLKQRWNIDIASGKRRPLDIHRLLAIYFHADKARYVLETGLDSDSINQLHGLLARYIANELQHQQCERVLTKIGLVTCASPQEKPHALFLLGQALFAENKVDVARDPALSIFQYLDHKLLRPQQIKALDRLLSLDHKGLTQEAVEKIIMGGGKSKIILPALAYKKATGNNLVVIEVPRALLRTNYIDLKATSSKLFKQSAYLFEFNRDSDCSSERLEQLYNQLSEVMVNKQYMVTTGDALQSLELKYLELLMTPPNAGGIEPAKAKKQLHHWKNQVRWAERLVFLFKHRADVMIDEAHHGLLLKTKLNYTLGKPRSIPKSVIRDSIDLYQFFNKVELVMAPGAKMTLYDALIQRNVLTDTERLTQAITTLTEQLVTHEQSPLFNQLKAWTEAGAESVSALLKQYLRNEGDCIPDFVKTAPVEVQERIAFYKEQISNMLSFTLKRQQGEHYGPSQLTSHTPYVRLLAIPYSANNVPNERSRFGNDLESINYTIQSLLITGLPQDVFRAVLNDWLTQARKELFDGKASSIDTTAMAFLFKSMVAGKDGCIPLSQLDADNEQQLAALHQQLSHDPSFIFEVLKSNILNHIKTNDAILHSNAYNHVDLVRSCQGMTGTPWNHSTFHQRLHYAEKSARGTDGYVLHSIQEKKPTIYAVDFTTTPVFIDALFSKCGDKTDVRTIIDINASFKGVSNLVVAKELAQYIQHHPEKFNTPEAIKYILFFNESNEIAALRVQADMDAQIPIVIGSSEQHVIDARLGCSPAARFTYYDQAHTVGADITQSPQARGLVLIDQDTHMQSFLQGSMRMRGLVEGDQSIDLVLPFESGMDAHSVFDKCPRTGETMTETKLFNNLSQKMVSNEETQLQQDNFNAAKAKITNIVRHDFMKRLLLIDGPKAVGRKHQLLIGVQDYFVEQQSMSFFERYGTLSTQQNTADILTAFQAKTVSNWERLLNAQGITPQSEEKGQLKTSMQAIINEATALGVCAAKQLVPKAMLAEEVEVQQETQVDVLTEQLIQKEMYDPQLPELLYQPWGRLDFQGNSANTALLNLKTLTDICKSSSPKGCPEFSSLIQASQNFYQSYTGQKSFVGMFLKPVHALMFKQENEQLRCTILSQQEYREITEWPLPASCWISTTQHTILAGQPPVKYRDNPDYQSIIEQVRFFNGEFKSLLDRKSMLSWLETDTKKKFDFFKQHLWACHETPVSDVNTLDSLFSVNTKVYQFIAQKPWDNYSEMNWKDRFPDCDEADISGYQAVAAAFHEATYGKACRDASTLANKHNLPLHARGYFTRYVEQVAIFKEILNQLDRQCALEKNNLTMPSFVAQLNEQQTDALKTFVPSFNTERASMSGTQIDYSVLTSLTSKIPLFMNDVVLWTALSFSPHLKEDQITTLINMMSSDFKVVLRLLTNHHDKLMPKHVATLQNAMTTYPAGSLLALASHPFLPEALCLSVMHQATYHSNPNQDEILLQIIKRPKLSFSSLKAVIANRSLNQTQVKEILKKPDYLIDQTLYLTLFNYYPSMSIQAIYLNCMAYTDEKLVTLIQSSRDIAFIKCCVTHKNAGVLVLNAIINDPASKVELLNLVAEKITSENELFNIMNHSQLADSTFSILFARYHITSDLLVRLVKNTQSPVLIDTLLSRLPKPYEEVYTAVVHNSVSTSTSLMKVAGSTKNPKTITSILTHGSLTNDILREIVKKSNDMNVLTMALTNAHCTDEVLQSVLDSSCLNMSLLKKVMAHPKRSKTTFTIVAKKLSDTDNFSALFDFNEIYQNWALYDSVTQNKTLSVSVLRKIAEKASHSRWIADILLCPNIDEAAIQLLLKNPCLEIETLLNLLDLPLALDLINKNDKLRHDVLNHRLMNEKALVKLAQGLDRASAVLNELVDHSKATSMVDKSILSSNALSVSALRVIAERANEKCTLLDVMKKSKDTKVLNTILSHPLCDDSILKLMHSGASQEIIHKIIEHSQVRAPTLLDLVANANDSDLLQKIWKNKNSDNSVFCAIANHKQATASILSRLAIIKSIHEQTLEAIINHAAAAAETLMIALNNQNLTKKNLLSLLSSKAVEPLILHQSLSNGLVDEEILLKIMERAGTDAVLLEKIVQHTRATNTVYERVIPHAKSLNTVILQIMKRPISDSVVELIVRNTNDPNVLKLTTEKPACSDQTLQLIVKKKLTDPKLYQAITKHPCATVKTLEDAMENMKNSTLDLKDAQLKLNQLQQLKKLCENYLCYACHKLDIPVPKEGFPIRPISANKNTKRTLLDDKHDMALTLYNIANQKDKTHGNILAEFRANLQSAESTFKMHRDNQLIRFFASLWAALKGFLKKSTDHHVGFWQPSKSEKLCTLLEKNSSSKFQREPGLIP